MARFMGVTGSISELERNNEELSVAWDIPNFFNLSARGGDCYASHDFYFNGALWCLGMYTNGYIRNRPSEYVNLYLGRKDKGPPMTIQYTLSISNVEGVETKGEVEHTFSEALPWRGWPAFLSRHALRNHKYILMPDGVLRVRCIMKNVVCSPVESKSYEDTGSQTDGEIEESNPCTCGSKLLNKQDATTEADADLKESLTNGKQSPGKKGVEELTKSLHGLLAGLEDSDVRISVGGKEFPAHRVILRARSPVFKAMFAHDMVERQSGVVTMKDCGPEAFPDFLEHVYTGSVEMISVGNVSDLYRTSDKYDLNALKTECTQFLKQNLTVASFCNTITLSIRHSDKDLTACATEFFCDNSLEIVETAEWQTFLQENSTVGNELFIKALRRNQNK